MKHIAINISISILYLLVLASCSGKEGGRTILNVSSGSIERIEKFQSDYVEPRNVDIWLPDRYSSEEKFAVIYMHDGQMLYDSTKSWNKQEWCVDETMSQLIKGKKIRNTIVVGIWNTEFRHSEYFPQKPFESLPKSYRDSLLNVGNQNHDSGLFKTPVCSDNYLKFIVEELKPFIDKNYSTLRDRENTFIAGSSMGGLISMYALCEYPKVFKGAACLSTHWPGIFDTVNNPIPEKFAEYLDSSLPPGTEHKIYFDYGTETLDAIYEAYQLMVDSIMREQSFSTENWKSLKFEGENHSERSWSKRLDLPLIFLLGEED